MENLDKESQPQNQKSIRQHKVERSQNQQARQNQNKTVKVHKTEEASLRSAKESNSKNYIPKEFESVPVQQKKQTQSLNNTNLVSGSIPDSSWKNLFEELRYEQNLLKKDLIELSSSTSFVSKTLLKKFTTIVSTKVRQRAEYYPDIVRDLADSVCDMEKKFLNKIKDPNEEK